MSVVACRPFAGASGRTLCFWAHATYLRNDPAAPVVADEEPAPVVADEDENDGSAA